MPLVVTSVLLHDAELNQPPPPAMPARKEKVAPKATQNKTTLWAATTTGLRDGDLSRAEDI